MGILEIQETLFFNLQRRETEKCGIMLTVQNPKGITLSLRKLCHCQKQKLKEGNLENYEKNSVKKPRMS